MAGEPTARFALNLLVDDDGRLLLLERSREARLGPGLWGLPAGRIEPGESAEQAARREMDEEIGPSHEVTAGFEVLPRARQGHVTRHHVHDVEPFLNLGQNGV